MATTNTSAPNRASLLAGLRTGGVRSSSNIPHTAAPGGSFNIPRISFQQPSVFPEEYDEPAQFAQNVFAVNHGPARTMPMTAAVDGPNNRFMMQQQRDVNQNPNIGSFSPAFAAQPNHVQAQALQMQMMQLEIIRMQTIQAQQYQAQMLAQSQPQSARRPNFNPPATAGPTGSFDLRSATLNAQMRRSVRPQDDDQVPMTAALGGKFGSRPMGRFSTDDYDDSSVPLTPNSTTVISGGTSLGGTTPVNANAASAAAVSKSETASNWRRGGNNNSVLRGANRPAVVKTSPPPTERRLSPPPALTSAPLGKSRPLALHFSGAASQPMPAVAIDTSEGDNDDGYSTSSSESAASNSPPTTPRSSSSLEISVSPPKDAAKAMPAALGLGHPPSFLAHKASSHRLASQPMRQPRGPPSGPDELGPRNFAARIVSRSTTVVA
ncbi:hypothetical protein B0H17DRAFT_1326064 [Mycena rosella]|uniref:Uncharacterized protein n=1 Tax=Mycena rosella TaxID=1033263 RepID=A0AAD7GVU7_MYCRO|nr:hypothetical protein B0H17DRAFT_1326064 [Mycena rosella]